MKAFEVAFLSSLCGVVVGLLLGEWIVTTGERPVLRVDVHRAVQTLEKSGTLITVDSGGRTWVWDEKHRLSYQIPHDLAMKLAGGAK